VLDNASERSPLGCIFGAWPDRLPGTASSMVAAEFAKRVAAAAWRCRRGRHRWLDHLARAVAISGWFWIDALRSSIRAVWRLPEYRIPGRLVVRVLFDLLVLVGRGVLLAASLAVVFATTAVAGRLVTAARVNAVRPGGCSPRSGSC
jgi:hypothetical protein